MPIFKKFWFYFNAIPVLLGIFAFYKLNSFPPRGNFKDALDYCKDVDNERMLSEGAEQDYSIDSFMAGYFSEAVPWDVTTSSSYCFYNTVMSLFVNEV